MKMKNKLNLFLFIAAALSWNVMTAVGQPIDSVKSLSNSAIAASPRTKETFPWLAVSGAEPTRSKTSKSTLAVAKENSAIVVSPRMKELFPELARGAEKSFEVAPLK
jgi:hypothetical protein